MAKNNRPDRDPRTARHEDAQHAGSQQSQAAGGMNAHSPNHAEADHEHAATATMAQKKEQAGNSPTSMKSKKGNQPKHNQPKR
ncbi:hypothetical protein ACFQZ4_41360 [Catellatospora coxensis]|uniref:Uncharacterized protein n=1 Tax=Catellatospora coxensis TaxID=310354 RepID=A0A8J3LA16_9ACTN|nr:hypothetical protein [Catellatospora coxensis]GIG11256.1 hypothetical protein Cco03nite_79560 [Catellatospora coxensis]